MTYYYDRDVWGENEDRKCRYESSWLTPVALLSDWLAASVVPKTLTAPNVGPLYDERRGNVIYPLRVTVHGVIEWERYTFGEVKTVATDPYPSDWEETSVVVAIVRTRNQVAGKWNEYFDENTWADTELPLPARYPRGRGEVIAWTVVRPDRKYLTRHEQHGLDTSEPPVPIITYRTTWAAHTTPFTFDFKLEGSYRFRGTAAENPMRDGLVMFDWVRRGRYIGAVGEPPENTWQTTVPNAKIAWQERFVFTEEPPKRLLEGAYVREEAERQGVYVGEPGFYEDEADGELDIEEAMEPIRQRARLGENEYESNWGEMEPIMKRHRF